MQPGVRSHSQHWCPTRENHHHAVRKSSAPPPSFVTPICWSSVFLRSGAVRFSLRRVCTYVPCERESPCDPHRDPHPQSNCLAVLRVSQRVTRHAIHLRTLATPKIRKKSTPRGRQHACLQRIIGSGGLRNMQTAGNTVFPTLQQTPPSHPFAFFLDGLLAGYLAARPCGIRTY